jgi:hypothetical protein
LLESLGECASVEVLDDNEEDHGRGVERHDAAAEEVNNVIVTKVGEGLTLVL